MHQKIASHKSAISVACNSHEKTLSGKQLPQSEHELKPPNAKQTALSNFEKMPDIGKVRIWVVMALLGISASSVWRLVSAGKLKTYKLTPRTTTFNVGELRVLLATKAVQ